MKTNLLKQYKRYFYIFCLEMFPSSSSKAPNMQVFHRNMAITRDDKICTGRLYIYTFETSRLIN